MSERDMSGLQSKLSTSKKISMRLVKEPKTRSTIGDYMQKLNGVSHKKLNLLLKNAIAKCTHSYKVHSVYLCLNNTIAVSSSK